MSERMEEPGSDEAGDAAVEWFVKLRAGPLPPTERAELDSWLAESPENARAFEEVLRLYGRLAGMSPARDRRRALRRGRPYGVAVAALAAALALFVASGEIMTRLRADHHAGVGETRTLTLADGSHAQIDSRSAIALRFTAAERRVVLLEGEAWFEVAPDPARPFVVEAAGGTVTALGTAFDVALERGGANVVVTEHRVAVRSGGATTIVHQGQQSGFARDIAARAPEPIDADAATAWRRGKLIVSKKPLGDVLAAIGRYRRGVVYCLDATICARRVSGVFGADDPMRSLEEIEVSLGLRAIRLTDYMILLY